MSILMEVLQEELDCLDRQEAAYSASLQELPKGYISKKNIRGKVYYYLQYRENGKVVSKYIPIADLPKVEEQIKRRKQLKASLSRVNEDRKRLKRVLR